VNHEEYEVLISAQLDGELSPAEEKTLAEHLAVCPACRKTKHEMQQVHLLLAGMAAAPPADLSERILTQLSDQPQRKPAMLWWRRAAPFAAAAAVVALVILGVVKPDLPFSGDGAETNQEYAVTTQEEAEEAVGDEEEAPQATESEPAQNSNGETEGHTASVQSAVHHAAPQPTGGTQAPIRDEKPAAALSPDSPGEESVSESAVAVEPTGTQEAEAGVPTETTEAEAAEDSTPLIDNEEPMEADVSEEDISPSSTGGGGSAGEAAQSEQAADRSERADSSSSLTWQQATERLRTYLGEAAGDLTMLGISGDGTRWLFSAGGDQYAVDRYTGAVIPLGSQAQ